MAIIYHLVTAAHWQSQYNHESYFSPTFEQEKFIHTSYSKQLNATANRYYSHENELIILHIETDKLQSELKVEFSNSVAQNFPHVYGGINLTAIIRVEYISRLPHSDWEIHVDM
jgi:uncharacterized protein (DUF952 family)